MHDALLQALAMLLSVLGMSWMALAMDVHWQQVHRIGPPVERPSFMLRLLATAAFVASLVLCIAANDVSIAALLWIMSLVASTVLVALALSARPHWLAWLAPFRG
jgi:predicted neutral ceramidase superfamily lipid hydrolase